MSDLARFRRLFGLCLFAVLPAIPVHAQQAPLNVIVAQVEEREIANELEALGTLMANETAVVTANLTETISRIHFNDGQRLKAGDVLVELTNREQVAQLDEARVALADAERQLQRARQLVESRFLSDQELDSRRREANLARARLNAVEARLADRLIRAPFDSVVGLRQVSVGTLLTPGTPVATLHDDSVMKLDFSVPETRMASVAVGQRVTATSRAFVGQTFEGEISGIDNEVDAVTRAVRVRALIPNPEGLLRPGMLMSVRIASAPRDALIIPEEALLPVGRQQFVMLAVAEGDGFKAERREITLGRRFPGEVEVLTGLTLGERVITHGAFRLRPDQPIGIRAELKAGESVAGALSDAANVN
ncbi:MAG: efflux transporter periplasmic adaptor subunit [Gammaproteobacteria bacterium HGW-Gammaproteobacteria-6]|nr:MAG: efflux transporter periplasmic adaptor subunit [Gammaproteobacteria bacterium HGW-Gammaproteobacteria-6]